MGKKTSTEVEAWMRDVALDADAKLADLSKSDLDALEAAYEDWQEEVSPPKVNGLKRFMAML